MKCVLVRIETENAAFETPEGRLNEVARLLRRLADDLEDNGLVDGTFILIVDINGNTVGRLATS